MDVGFGPRHGLVHAGAGYVVPVFVVPRFTLSAAITGILTAFWGVLAGALALFVQQYGKSHFSHPPSA